MSRVFQRGGHWYADYRDERGARVRVTLRGVSRKREAELELAELVAASRRRELGLEPAPANARASVWELCDWWLSQRCPAPSAAIERGRLEKHVRDTQLGRTALMHVRAEGFEALFAELERPPAPGECRKQLAAGSINHLRSKLRTVFERARREGIYHRPNPVTETKKRKVPKRVYETLTADEIDRVLAYIAPQWRNFVAATLYLALRKGEAAGALKVDLNLPARLIRIAHSYARPTTKGGHEDLLPVPEPMVPYLESALTTPGPFLFPRPDASMVHVEMDPHLRLRTAIGRAALVTGYELWCWHCTYSRTQATREDKVRCPVCLANPPRRAPVYLRVRPLPRHVRLHDLRHSAATILLRAGADMHRVQKLLRHSDVSTTTGTYGHLVVDDLRAAQLALRPNSGTTSVSSSGFTTEGSTEVMNPVERSRRDSNARPLASEADTPSDANPPHLHERSRTTPVLSGLKEGLAADGSAPAGTASEVETQIRHKFAATGTDGRSTSARVLPFRGGMRIDEG